VGLWGTVGHFWHSRRGLAIGLIVAAVLVVSGAALLSYQLLKRPADVHNSDATFVPQKPPKAKTKTVNWPMFGLNPARTRYLPAKGVKPPFRKLWRFTERPLLEFPPIYVGGKLYFVDNNGTARALDADTGKVLWERSIGRLNASSPAYYRHRLYIVNLVPGHIVKLDAKTGKTIWKRSLPGRAESSPVVIDRTVYFGCEDGGLYALSTNSGNVRWATDLNGPVKSAPAYYRGTLYVGDYGGSMNAVDAKTGKIRWQTASLGSGFGTSGAFYSTPAVAFGRVYAGNNDNRVYSFDRRDGTLAWSYSTGGYAYSGPTVSTTRHAPPTVYIGSFDGNVYALDAKDGGLRWSRYAGGQVIGSLSAIGDVVYAAEFTHNSTSGFMMRSGRRVFRYRRGTYSPVISDGRRIYLTGYSSITALQPYKLKRAVAPAIVAPKVKERSRPGAAAAPQGGSGRKPGKQGGG
jgi:outer membrane protein assembly factor BamB